MAVPTQLRFQTRSNVPHQWNEGFARIAVICRGLRQFPFELELPPAYGRLAFASIVRRGNLQLIREKSPGVPASLSRRNSARHFKRDRNAKFASSSPPAPTGQSVSNASHMKIAQKPRGTARFRRYERVSVCGFWQWRRHSCSCLRGPFLVSRF
jgi:hypothetical protein